MTSYDAIFAALILGIIIGTEARKRLALWQEKRRKARAGRIYIDHEPRPFRCSYKGPAR